MLIKSTSYQIFFSGLIRIVGFFITALLFRIYSIEEIGEYFLLISILSVFSSAVYMGADKPLIRNNLTNQSNMEYKILKTRILLSILCFPLFIIFSFTFINKLPVLSLGLLSLTLLFNSFGFDYLLTAKKKILELSILQFISQMFIFVLFFYCFLNELKPNIAVHQLLITSLITLLILIYVKIKIDFKLKPIFKSKIISLNYFKRNNIIIISIFFISFISSIDFIMAKYIFNDYELGIISGVLRFSLLSFGFLTIINKTLFSYSISSNFSNEYKQSSKKVSLLYNIISFLILLILIYPYLKFVMNLDNVDFIILPALIITLSSILMPNFFLQLNYIESNDKNFSGFLYFIYSTFFIVMYYLIGVSLTIIFQFENLYIYFSYLFLTKWILLNLLILNFKKKFISGSS
jgi:O-antigen/teichoic acid export membrane protein